MKHTGGKRASGLLMSSDDFTGLTPSGDAITKAILTTQPAPIEVKSIEFTEQYVQVFGQTAISRGASSWIRTFSASISYFYGFTASEMESGAPCQQRSRPFLKAEEVAPVGDDSGNPDVLGHTLRRGEKTYAGGIRSACGACCNLECLSAWP